MANSVVHFEIEAQDRERASKFYSEAFDWEMLDQKEKMGNYMNVGIYKII